MQLIESIVIPVSIIIVIVIVWALYERRIRLILVSILFFLNRTCFLVSDKKWQNVLGLVPIAYRSRPRFGSWILAYIVWLIGRILGMWTSLYTLVAKQPILIYHEEDDGAIDADSVIHFLQQFRPNRLYLVGDTPEELEDLLVASMPTGAEVASNSIYRISPADYTTFWSDFDEMVVVGRSDYKSALTGSVFASLKSIPIFFVDNNNLNDITPLFHGKKVYQIGDPLDTVVLAIRSNASSHVYYNQENIVSEYVHLTKTRKIIVVNPNDLEIGINVSFQPDKTANDISTLFAKGSLAAPILAAGRHEIIIYPSQDTPTRTDFDLLIEDYVNTGKISARFLTIIGNPNAIPQSIPANPPTGWDHRLELDGRHYGSTQTNLGYVDLATGRIYGMSPSDVSGNIARSLFYHYLPRNRDALVLPREDIQDGIADRTDEEDLEDYYRDNYWTNTIEQKFATTYFYSGHTEITNNQATIQGRYDEVHLVFFADHGSSVGFSGVISSYDFEADLVYLVCPTVIDLACSTGQWDIVSDNIKPRLFVVQSIRRGVIVQISAVSVSYWHQMFDELLNKMYIKKKSLGEAFRIAKNSEFDRNAFNFSSAYVGDPWYFLMGDPAFVPKFW